MIDAKVLLAFGALSAVCGSAHAGVIAAWDFQTTANGGTAAAASPASPKAYVANFGSGTLYLDGSNFSSDFFVPATGSINTEITSFGGTALNADVALGMSTVTSGSASLAVVAGAAVGSSYSANGKSMVFRFSMEGCAGLTISYATQRTGTGFTSQVFEYSTDGVNWGSIGSNASIQSSFSATGTPPGTVTAFSGITGLDGAATAFVRVTFSGATSPTGNNRFDNFIFSVEVPAPGGIALVAVGGILRCPRRRR
jgi:hypothetical protein